MEICDGGYNVFLDTFKQYGDRVKSVISFPLYTSKAETMDGYMRHL